MIQPSLMPDPADEVTPQDPDPEVATVISTDLEYDPADPKSFRYAVVEDLQNPAPPPGSDIVSSTWGTSVWMTIPDPRTPNKLTTLKVTAYRRESFDKWLLAEALVDLATEQVRAKQAESADDQKAA